MFKSIRCHLTKAIMELKEEQSMLKQYKKWLVMITKVDLKEKWVLS